METRLSGPRLVLRAGYPTDWKEWRGLRAASRDFLVPWEPTWPLDALGYEFFCGLLRRQARDWREGKAYAFLIFLKTSGEPETGGNISISTPLHSPDENRPSPPSLRDNALIGGISLNGVQRGIAQKGTLGYWIGAPFARHGYMTEAVGLVCDFAFKTLRLNRVEAGCLPRNEASRRLLAKLGFAEEGFARAYLRINGRWEDHLLWGKVKNALN